MASEPTIIFLPEGASLTLTEITEDKFIIMAVRGCWPHDLRFLKGNVEVKMGEFPTIDPENNDE